MIHYIINKVLLILFVIIFPIGLFGQIKVSGIIKNKSGETLPGINVLLGNVNKENILSYSISDNNGYYQVEYKGAADSLQITLTGFDYGSVKKTIKAVSQKLDFELTNQPIELQEVIVKPEMISQRGDTINYLVSAFVGKGDRVIGDVLKKMPGIEVRESGAISYNGKEINKFYVENLDLLQGRYGIATKNISANDVASVQVYENHQPVKALQDVKLSDQAAINIKLKDSAKGALSAMAQLGTGFTPFLWNNEFVALYFAKKYQNITTYKGNNTGDDASREFTSFYSEAGSMQQYGNFLSILAPSLPAINRKRYLFNSIHSVSANNIWVLKNDYNLNANINYFNDAQKQDSYSQSAYFLPGDSILIINEQLNAKKYIDKLNADIKLNVNKSNFYLDNHIKLSGEWNRNRGIVLTSDSINQQSEKNPFNISNTFKLVKTTSSGKIVEVNSFNGFSKSPQKLIIEPGLYPFMFNDSKDYDKMKQNVTINNFTSRNSVSYSFVSKHIRQVYWAGFDIESQFLKSDLQILNNNNINAAPDSLMNDLRWTQYNMYVNAYYSYFLPKFKIDIYLPVNYYFSFINNAWSKTNTNKLFFTPYLHAVYNLNNYWDISAHYSFSKDYGPIDNLYPNYIMQTYRDLNRNESKPLEYESHAASLFLSYKNPRKSLFGNMGGSYERFRTNVMYAQEYTDILQIRKIVESPQITESYSVSGSISKYIYAVRSTISLSGRYYNVKSSQINQGEVVKYNNENYGFSPNIETQLGSWGSISYALKWNESNGAIGNINLSGIRTISNYLNISFFINKLAINMGYEHYYNSNILTGKNKSFADIELKYKFKDVELMCTWVNVFNSKQYIIASYSETREDYYAYGIRPAQLLLTAKFKLW
ncbi:MAG: hypothetical protein LBL90_01830 [Prevotellaceae bacterium]|jgi:hypothetical protein|nr:hypothetical protein [Prevotellaceae bacterium]